MKNTQICNNQDYIRLDKFLKVSRILKRRTVAKDFCDASRVYINDNEAKPAGKVRVGDVVTVKIGDRYIKAKVLNINDKSTKEMSKEMYEIIEEIVDEKD